MPRPLHRKRGTMHSATHKPANAAERLFVERKSHFAGTIDELLKVVALAPRHAESTYLPDSFLARW